MAQVRSLLEPCDEPCHTDTDPSETTASSSGDLNHSLGSKTTTGASCQSTSGGAMAISAGSGTSTGGGTSGASDTENFSAASLTSAPASHCWWKWCCIAFNPNRKYETTTSDPKNTQTEACHTRKNSIRLTVTDPVKRVKVKHGRISGDL